MAQITDFSLLDWRLVDRVDLLSQLVDLAHPLVLSEYSDDTLHDDVEFGPTVSLSEEDFVATHFFIDHDGGELIVEVLHDSLDFLFVSIAVAS